MSSLANRNADINQTMSVDPGSGRFARVKFENRVQLGALLAGLPAVATALVCLWHFDFSMQLRLTLSLLILSCWFGGSVLLKEWIKYPLRTLSNLLGALHEGDYSLRGAAARHNDVLGEVIREVNALGDLLREQRVGALEGQALVGKILAEIDVAVFAFDAASNLRLVNQRGERLLGGVANELIGLKANSLGLQGMLEGIGECVVDINLPGGSGRWKLHRGNYRDAGRPQQLIIMTDLTLALHEEERAAWKRLIQTLRHEINNSLTPISSIAGSLRSLQQATPRPADWEDDLLHGLTVIEDRSESLHRFIKAYSEVTRLPQPCLGSVDIAAWIHRNAELDARMTVSIAEGPALTIEADGDQLDQLLINLIRNAIDAALPTKARVEIGWKLDGNRLHVWVDDEGAGVADVAQAFVPFYTTKPEGAGIGLPLSRQIAENHGGSLTLEKSPSTKGCRASLYLPATQPRSSYQSDLPT